MTKINIEQIRDLILSVPPFAEQHRIAEFLDQETRRVDALVERMQSGMESLREYRNAMVTAAPVISG